VFLPKNDDDLASFTSTLRQLSKKKRKAFCLFSVKDFTSKGPKNRDKDGFFGKD